MVMSRRPVVPPRIALKPFYVYDAGVGDTVGTFPVKVRDGLRVVMMTQVQADYWIAAGTIGPIPLEQVKGTRRGMLHQLSGGRIPAEQGGRVGKRGRNAVQDPNTMARALTEGYHPVTGTLVTNEDDRRRSQAKGKNFFRG